MRFKKKKKILIKIGRKQKKIYGRVVGPDDVRIMYKIVTSKKEKKRNHDLRRTKQSPSWLPTESLCPRLFLAMPKRKQKKEKAKTLGAKFPTKTPFSKKSY